MKVIITSSTGIKREALIDKDSGVLEFADGEISHVLYEKQFGKSIHVIKEAKKEAPKAEASDEQSKSAKKKKADAK